jgi:hypothetical protein
MNKKWYQSTGLMWVTLVLFWPIGIFLMWKYNNYSEKVKVAITLIILAAVMIWPMFTDDSTDDNNLFRFQMTTTTDTDGTVSTVKHSFSF